MPDGTTNSDGTYIPPDKATILGNVSAPTAPTGSIKGWTFDQTALDDLKKPVPPPPENYIQAFDPKSDVLSVNTGNASVRQLEDLVALASTPPKQDVSGDFGILSALVGLILFL